MMYHIASTAQEQPVFLSPAFRARADQAAAPRQLGPKGTHHAVEDMSKSTVCGLEVASLYDYPDLEWPPVRGDRCLYCRQWTPKDDE